MYLEGHAADGDTPEDFHHHDFDTCDDCGKQKMGTMIYGQGATGRICAVLFLCHECDPSSYKATKALPRKEQK